MNDRADVKNYFIFIILLGAIIFGIFKIKSVYEEKINNISKRLSSLEEKSRLVKKFQKVNKDYVNKLAALSMGSSYNFIRSITKWAKSNLLEIDQIRPSSVPLGALGVKEKYLGDFKVLGFELSVFGDYYGLSKFIKLIETNNGFVGNMNIAKKKNGQPGSGSIRGNMTIYFVVREKDKGKQR